MRESKTIKQLLEKAEIADVDITIDDHTKELTEKQHQERIALEQEIDKEKEEKKEEKQEAATPETQPAAESTETEQDNPQEEQ